MRFTRLRPDKRSTKKLYAVKVKPFGLLSGKQRFFSSGSLPEGNFRSKKGALQPLDLRKSHWFEPKISLDSGKTSRLVDVFKLV